MSGLTNSDPLRKAARDYQAFTKTTAVYPGSTEAQGLAYVTLGLLDEIAETVEKALSPPLKRAEIVKEAGDVYWYAARICDHLELDFADVVFYEYDGLANLLDAELRAFCFAGALAGRVKKIIRDGHLWTEDQRTKVERIIFEALRKTISSINVLVRFVGSNPAEVMVVNMDKLSGRKDRGVLQGDGDNR